MSKTKPFSIRFDEDKLNFIKEAKNLKTEQKVVDFLLDEFWWKAKLGVTASGDIVFAQAPPVTMGGMYGTSPRIPAPVLITEEAEKPPVIKDKGAKRGSKKDYPASVGKILETESAEDIPVREKGESGLAYSIRLSEWKDNQKTIKQ